MNKVIYKYCKSLFIIIICFIAVNSGSSANSQSTDFFQRLEIPSSPNPVGSGARALGMGGAFIGIADDATAASWNPGGLIQLELPEISMAGAGFYRKEDNTFSIYPESSNSGSVSQISLNYLSAALPFKAWNKNMIISLNYQNLFDFNRKWNFPMQTENEIFSIEQTIDYEQKGQLSAYGLAYCIQITPRFSFGLTFNLWEHGIRENEWEQTTVQQGTGNRENEPFNLEYMNKNKYSFSGFNTNLGMLWEIIPGLTLGAVIKLPFEADIKHEKSFSGKISYTNSKSPDFEYSDQIKTDESLDMPMSYGIGIGYRISNSITASLDIYRTQWDDYLLKDNNGREISPITGKSAEESDIDATHQVRMGAEYLLKESEYMVPFRCGIFYDPSPSKGSPDDFFGFSLGSGFAVKEFSFDAAYQYRFGNNAGASVLEIMGFSQDVREHTMYSSIIYRF